MVQLNIDFGGGSSVIGENNSAFYETKPENWYKALPYGFRINFSTGTSYSVFLPISPSNLTISTNFATNMVPTLYGTVEEHSDVRYFDIVIEGTTGVVPKFVNPQSSASEAQSGGSPNPGRQSFSVGSKIALGGFFSKTLGALNQIKTKALDVIDGSQKPNEPGFSDSETGYLAFHNLYKMLLRHKKDAAGVPISGTSGFLGGLSALTGVKPERKAHPIIFFNYKDGNQYNVVIKNFTMRRSAENPMLYYYSIQMRGYQLASLNGQIKSDDKDRLRQLGLDGVDGSSILGEIKKRANSAKGVLGAASGGINVLGR